MPEYKDFVYHDELTNLDYLYWDEYLDNKELFSGGKAGSKYIEEWLINGSIISEISHIREKMITSYSWMRWILSCINTSIDGRISRDEFISAISKIDSVITDISVQYRNSKCNEGIWKYIDISIEDLFEDIKDINNFGLTLEKICSYSYLSELKLLLKEKKND